VIAASKPCRPIGGGEYRFDLGPRQEMYLTFVVPLAWYREDALDMGAIGRLLEGREPEEGALLLQRKNSAAVTLRRNFP
jgi:hypothetical protein